MRTCRHYNDYMWCGTKRGTFFQEEERKSEAKNSITAADRNESARVRIAASHTPIGIDTLC